MADNTYLSINTNTSTNIEDNTDKILVFDEAQVYGISYENLVKEIAKEIAKEIINSNASSIKGTGSNAEIFNDYIDNKATGAYSHVEGAGTQTTNDYQHVQGRYNATTIEMLDNVVLNYLHIVGNGTGDQFRSNAHTLRDNGDAWVAGDVYIHGTSQADSNAKRVPVVYVGNDTPNDSTGINGDIYCKLL